MRAEEYSEVYASWRTFTIVRFLAAAILIYGLAFIPDVHPNRPVVIMIAGVVFLKWSWQWDESLRLPIVPVLCVALALFYAVLMHLPGYVGIIAKFLSPLALLLATLGPCNSHVVANPMQRTVWRLSWRYGCILLFAFGVFGFVQRGLEMARPHS